MKDARKIGGIAGNESQRALVIERLETVEQLTGDFQVGFHSETDQYEFIDFRRRANGECCRPDASNRKIGLAERNLCRAGALRVRLRGAGLSFPYRQAANRAPLKILIPRDCANDVGKSATGLDEVELASLARFLRSERARDARRVPRGVQPWDGGGRTDQSKPEFWLLIAPPLREIRAVELFSINRKDSIGFLWQPFASAWRLENHQQCNCQPNQH